VVAALGSVVVDAGVGEDPVAALASDGVAVVDEAL
jgi:hypothetical protein